MIKFGNWKYKHTVPDGAVQPSYDRSIQTFKEDTDRHAWRAYAAAALSGSIIEATIAEKDVPLIGIRADPDFEAHVECAAHFADLMLQEERKRR